MTYVCALLSEKQQFTTLLGGLGHLPLKLQLAHGHHLVFSYEKEPAPSRAELLESYLTELAYWANFCGLNVRLGVGESPLAALGQAEYGPLPAHLLPWEKMQNRWPDLSEQEKAVRVKDLTAA
jgi:hypothetical protein